MIPATLPKHGTAAMMSRIAGINYPVETTMWCTSTMWESLVGELSALPADAFMDPSRPPTPTNFRRMKIMSTTFINSGTADKRVCDLRNDAEERKANFREKHDRFAMRASEKKPAIEYVDAASTHDVPDDLLKQVANEARTVNPIGAVGVSNEIN
jgi:hypothetical protein